MKKDYLDSISKLNSWEYEVTQNAATDPPFEGKFDQNFEKGIYVDVVSGEALFCSLDKYDAGCGWPSFTKPIDKSTLDLSSDLSHGRVRTEVKSADAQTHLGHVFDDGPQEFGGLRYCINSSSLRFIPYESLEAEGYSEFLSLFNKK